MNKVTLDGKNMKDLASTHVELKSKLALPDYYGENLDALMDCLTGWVDLPLEVTWKSFEKSRKCTENYTDKIANVMCEAPQVTLIRL